MVTVLFEEALIDTIRSMSEIEKESFFEKLSEVLARDNQEHTMSGQTVRQLERRIDELEESQEDYDDLQLQKEDAEERLERIKDDLSDALKKPLNELHNKIEEILNDI